MTTTHETILDLIRSVKFFYDGDGWIAEIPGEDDLWAVGRTPEETLSELFAILEEEFAEEEEEEEEESYQPIESSLDPGLPGPFGIPWRWILIPALIATLLLITMTVRSGPVETVPTPLEHNQWSAPVVYPAPPTRDIWREIEMERRLRDIERRLEMCSDPDLPPHLLDRCR